METAGVAQASTSTSRRVCKEKVVVSPTNARANKLRKPLKLPNPRKLPKLPSLLNQKPPSQKPPRKTVKAAPRVRPAKALKAVAGKAAIAKAATVERPAAKALGAKAAKAVTAAKVLTAKAVTVRRRQAAKARLVMAGTNRSSHGLRADPRPYNTRDFS